MPEPDLQSVLAEIDQREFHRTIADYVADIRVRPDLSILAGSQAQMDYLTRMLQSAGPEQRPLIEAEIEQQRGRLERIKAELETVENQLRAELIEDYKSAWGIGFDKAAKKLGVDRSDLNRYRKHGRTAFSPKSSIPDRIERELRKRPPTSR